MVELNERARPMTWFRPVFLVAVALCATAFADEGLIGSWVGASGDNEGERVVVERGAVTIEGERLPLRFVGPGLLEIGPPGDTAQLRYRLVGDTLTTEGEDGRLTWKRERPAPQPQPQPQPKPPPEGRPPAAAPSGPLVMKEHRLVDPGMRNMESHRVLAPKGWTVKGGGWWPNQRYFNVLPSRDIKVTSPAGAQVHLAPSILAKDWLPPPDSMVPRPREGAADKGLPVIYLPESLAAWKEWMTRRGVPLNYPGATEVRTHNAVVIPELTQLLRKQIEWRRAMLAQQAQQDARAGLRTFIDALALAFECSYRHEGREWEELTVFGLSWEGMEGRLIGRSTTWSINPAVVYRAPKGELEAQLPLLVAIANSCRVTPQWARMRAEHQAKMLGIARKGAAAASEAIAARGRLLSDVNDIIHQGWKKRNAISDSTQRKLVNSIHGTEDYVVPGGSASVQLPNAYKNVYTNGQGEYLLTNDALFDPNTDPLTKGQQWTGMQPRQ